MSEHSVSRSIKTVKGAVLTMGGVTISMHALVFDSMARSGHMAVSMRQRALVIADQYRKVLDMAAEDAEGVARAFIGSNDDQILSAEVGEMDREQVKNAVAAFTFPIPCTWTLSLYRLERLPRRWVDDSDPQAAVAEVLSRPEYRRALDRRPIVATSTWDLVQMVLDARIAEDLPAGVIEWAIAAAPGDLLDLTDLRNMRAVTVSVEAF